MEITLINNSFGHFDLLASLSLEKCFALTSLSCHVIAGVKISIFNEFITGFCLR